MNEDLFRLDLAQVERVRRLHERVARGLEMWDYYTRMIATQENLADMDRAGLDAGQAVRVPIDRLREEQGKSLSVLKAAVWNASEGLRSDHTKRRELQKADEAETKDETKE